MIENIWSIELTDCELFLVKHIIRRGIVMGQLVSEDSKKLLDKFEAASTSNEPMPSEKKEAESEPSICNDPSEPTKITFYKSAPQAKKLKAGRGGTINKRIIEIIKRNNYVNIPMIRDILLGDPEHKTKDIAGLEIQIRNSLGNLKFNSRIDNYKIGKGKYVYFLSERKSDFERYKDTLIEAFRTNWENVSDTDVSEIKPGYCEVCKSNYGNLERHNQIAHSNGVKRQNPINSASPKGLSGGGL